MERSVIDVASGGVLVDKTPFGSKEFDSKHSRNFTTIQQYIGFASTEVNEANVTSNIEQQLAILTSLIQKMATGDIQL